MDFLANHVSASAAGDYYQVLFEAAEDSTDISSPYLLIQRQFEVPDGGVCYIETHDENYIGHFHLHHIEFTPNGITVAMDRSNDNRIHVTFSISTSAFEEVASVLQIIICIPGSSCHVENHALTCRSTGRQKAGAR
jgi:hypothetical protein